MNAFATRLSDDCRLLSLLPQSGSATPELSASEVDELIRALVAKRAQMTPIHSAVPPADLNAMFTGDNLLWNVRMATKGQGLELNVQHPGIGWLSLALSLAQIEDLKISIEFTLDFCRSGA